MAVGGFGSIPGSLGIVVSRKKPGHFIALTEDGRIDAFLTQNVRLADVLEKRAPVSVNNAQQGPTDGSSLEPANSLRSIDPYDITIAMPAADGEPAVSDADRDAWGRFRMTYQVTIEATPFSITGRLMLLPSQHPLSLTERGTELFLPVFDPTVQVGGVALKNTPRDSILVNRSHIRRVSVMMKS